MPSCDCSSRDLCAGAVAGYMVVCGCTGPWMVDPNNKLDFAVRLQVTALSCYGGSILGRHIFHHASAKSVLSTLAVVTAIGFLARPYLPTALTSKIF